MVLDPFPRDLTTARTTDGPADASKAELIDASITVTVAEMPTQLLSHQELVELPQVAEEPTKRSATSHHAVVKTSDAFTELIFKTPNILFSTIIISPQIKV